MRFEERSVLSASTDVAGKTMKDSASARISSSSATGSASVKFLPKTPLPPSNKETTVKFDDSDIQIHFVPLVEDMDKDEINATWYRKEDYEVMKEEYNEVVEAMKATPASLILVETERPDMTFRGLEHRLPMFAKRRRTNMTRAANAVFTEQSRQVQAENRKPDLLATIYEGYTKLCAADAERQGKDDEIALLVMDQQQDGHEQEGQQQLQEQPEEDLKQKLKTEDTTKPQVVTHQYSDIAALADMMIVNTDILSISDESSAAADLVISVDEFDDDNISVLSDTFDAQTTSSNSISSRGKRIAKRFQKMLRKTRTGRQ